MSTYLKTCLGFDFGTKRIGVAVGRSLLGTASPLPPIVARDGIPDWTIIEKMVSEWKPDGFVVGLPLNMDGTSSDMSLRATKFAKRLQGRFNKPYFMMDERLSSHEAKGFVIASGGNRDFGENSVDGIAASLILESWFSQQSGDD